MNYLGKYFFVDLIPISILYNLIVKFKCNTFCDKYEQQCQKINYQNDFDDDMKMPKEFKYSLIGCLQIMLKKTGSILSI